MKAMDGFTFTGVHAEKLRACLGCSLHIFESKGIPVFVADETGLISPMDAPKVPQYFQSAIRIGGSGVRLWYEVLVSWFQRTGVDVEVSAALCESRASGPVQFEKRPLYSKQFTDFTAAHVLGANFAVYAATKAAIAAFATSLRAEVSADGIRVTELVPGRVETALYKGVLSAEARQAMYEGGDALQPSDVAEAVLAVLQLPSRADVTRLDIMPTRPVPPISLK